MACPHSDAACKPCSCQVLANQACQLKHGNLVFAKNRVEFGIGVDRTFVAGVLQALGFDVVPQLFDDFGARNLRAADHGGQLGAGR